MSGMLHSHSLNYSKTILHTPIFNKGKPINLHDIVLLYKPLSSKIIVIDFAPKKTDYGFIKLLLNRSVRGEIRIKNLNLPFEIENLNKHNKKEIIQLWRESLPITQPIPFIGDENEIMDFNNVILKIQKKLEWNLNMNLYTNNCKHFSHRIVKILDE
jgi:hypothetical protein